ncbi:expressed unknown protein [Ectocarpus siliculosus]|uniref:Uncharacterized protein n=1 Tax=Ectocarpus siliculosus TaxID=2880 RepID=D7G1L5_ECTSI|nr:expressed unknown protein [Ectocarpus siliculosus]|eukprot:CBJ33260.1 expressed unknown protein [Ectocarpus siliculosus]
MHTSREGACGVVHGDGRSDTSVGRGRVHGKGSRPIESTNNWGGVARTRPESATNKQRRVV